MSGAKRPSPETLLAHAGRNLASAAGEQVNPPLHRASGVVFATPELLQAAKEKGRRNFFYGRFGNPTVYALESAVAELEGAQGAIAVPSGLAACMIAIRSSAGPGDHVLIGSSAFSGIRKAAARFGRETNVEISEFDPRMGLDGQLRANTRAVYVENPGCTWLEVADVAAISNAAHAASARVIVDNTWATPYLCNPISAGADIVVHSATKYIGGHDDVVLGVIACASGSYDHVREAVEAGGYAVGADDAYLALRGLRTLAVRMDRHGAGAAALMDWLRSEDAVQHIHHPISSGHLNRDVFKRDFRGTAGLFSITLAERDFAAVVEAMSTLELFQHGVGWGGFSSMIELIRKDAPGGLQGVSLRLHIGLESVDDLRTDLERLLRTLSRRLVCAKTAGGG